MNKERRGKIQKLIDTIEAAQEELSEIMDAESEYRDNIPENLQTSWRYEAADNACNTLDDAFNSISEALSSLSEAIE